MLVELKSEYSHVLQREGQKVKRLIYLPKRIKGFFCIVSLLEQIECERAAVFKIAVTDNCVCVCRMF